MATRTSAAAAADIESVSSQVASIGTSAASSPLTSFSEALFAGRRDSDSSDGCDFDFGGPFLSDGVRWRAATAGVAKRSGFGFGYSAGPNCCSYCMRWTPNSDGYTLTRTMAESAFASGSGGLAVEARTEASRWKMSMALRRSQSKWRTASRREG